MSEVLADFSTATITDSGTGAGAKITYSGITFDKGTASLEVTNRAGADFFLTGSGGRTATDLNYAQTRYDFDGTDKTATAASIQTNSANTGGPSGGGFRMADFKLTLSDQVSSLKLHVTNLDHTVMKFDPAIYDVKILSSVISSAPTIPGSLIDDDTGGFIYTLRSDGSGTKNAPSADFTLEVTRKDGASFNTVSWLQQDNAFSNGTAAPNNSANDGFFLQFSGIMCFARGTLINTDSGPVAVETLQAGMLVLTADHGLQPVRWIGSRKLTAAELEAQPNLQPIRIGAGVLRNGVPATDLVVSPQHRILVRSKIAQRLFGTDEVLVAAKQLLIIDGIDVDHNLDGIEYFHFLFDDHQVVISNGAETESLYTGPEALKAVGVAAQEEIFAIFPQLRDRDPNQPPEGARMLLSGRQGRKLAQRHVKNHKSLIS